MANSTFPVGSADIIPTHQAGGRSIFWAMTALALYAMSQPSFTGTVWSGDIAESSLWPHRVSPFVCLVDAAADIWIIVDRVRHPPTSEKREHSNPTTVVVTLALFVFGTLPQAIKLFCMRGIPVAQVIAAIFLVSSVASLARSLHLKDPYKDLVNFTSRIGPNAFLAIFLFGVLPDLILIWVVWSVISPQLDLAVCTDTVVIIQLTTIAIDVGVLLYLAQHCAFFWARKVWSLRPAAAAPVFVIANTSWIIQQVVSPENRMSWFLGYGIAQAVAFDSWLVMCLLMKVVERVVHRPAKEGAEGSKSEGTRDESTTTGDDNEEESATSKVQFEMDLPPHTFWLAFVLLNFATMATYLLGFYDGRGTYSPSWTSFLG